MKPGRLCLVILLVQPFLAPFAAAQDAADAAGSWTVTMERPAQWTPRTARARLTLQRTGRKWSGHIRFDTLMNGRRVPLRDIVVTSRTFAFRWDVKRFEVSMEGRWTAAGLTGECVWKGAGTWPFSAERAAAPAKPKRVVRVEEGLSHDGYFPPVQAEDAGISPDALDRLIAVAEKSDTDALLILKDSKVVCERYFGRRPGPIHLMSVTKFVTSFAVARLLEEKKLDLDTPVSHWFPEWKTGEKAKVTVRHLMAHTSGLVHERLAHALNKADDKVAHVRKLACKAPGSECRYSNEGVALLSGILAKAAGGPVDAYLKEKVFSPMGIRGWRWDRDKAGHTITYAQLSMTARDLARLGRHAARKPTEFEGFAKPGSAHDPSRGLIWRLYRDPKGFGHTGWLGQHLVVFPEHGLVAVRLRRARETTEHENHAHEFPAFARMLADLVR